ncbi:MAG: type IV toxin-antitoxin system AbiEi family antitoxin domain-containing protein [Candidatus Woesearchaeota archaeon]
MVIKISYALLVKKLYLIKKIEKKDGIITSDEIKEYCKNKIINLNYNNAISYLLNNNYLERIFRGIFYIRSIEEKKNKTSNINYFETISKALKIKNVKNWYFGLESALKLNNLTHETFFIETIITNKIKNTNPIKILNKKTKITKINSIKFNFGIKKEKINNEIYYYSDTERTLLDIVFLLKYNNHKIYEIKNKISDYKYNKNKLNRYLKYYPKSIKEVFK